MTYYSRKSTRIKNYDYSSSNYYFLTICTYHRRCIFGDPWKLNEFGKIAEKQIMRLESYFDTISVDKYVVMPNHIHMIVKMDNTDHNPI